MQKDEIETLTGDLPTIDEAALKRAEAAERAEPEQPAAKPAANDLRDRDGVLFDPEKYATDSSGKPKYRKGRNEGRFAKKRGRKPEAETEAKPTAGSKVDEGGGVWPELERGAEQQKEQDFSVLEATAAEMAELSLLPAVAIWGHSPTPLQEATVFKGWKRVCERYEVKEPPPSLELALALGAVYVPLITVSLRKPENISKLDKARFWIWRKWKNLTGSKPAKPESTPEEEE